MSKDVIEGEMQKLKGKAREEMGRIAGNPKQKLLGKYEQRKGTIKKKVARLKYRV